MGQIRIGVCSWADRGLIASEWYPKDCRTTEGRLKHYASQFSTVEVDSCFYSIPEVEQVYRWIALTPPGFIFNVKCYGLFTFHAVEASSLPAWAKAEIRGHSPRVTYRELPWQVRLELWKQFQEAVMPLYRTGKLGYLLFQLPPWLGYSHRMLEYIDRLADVAGKLPVAFEIRNRSWLLPQNAPSFLRALKERDIAYVIADEPRLDWTPPPEMHFTASWGALFRFHGHNAEAWRKRGASVAERFRYLYKLKELREWKERICQAEIADQDIYMMFNNCYSDYGVRNAAQMADLFRLDRGSGAWQRELEF